MWRPCVQHDGCSRVPMAVGALRRNLVRVCDVVLGVLRMWCRASAECLTRAHTRACSCHPCCVDAVFPLGLLVWHACQNAGIVGIRGEDATDLCSRS
eukprot:3342044-Alexandrium_andersonii.AAC.1